MKAEKWVIEVERVPATLGIYNVDTLSYTLTHVVGKSKAIEAQYDGLYHLADLWHELGRTISKIDGWEHF